MIGGGNSTTRPGILANRPVLVEGRGATHRGLIDLLVLVDIVDGTITGNSALVCHGATRVVIAVVLHDVVLDQWAGSPTIDGQVCVAGRTETSFESDITGERERKYVSNMLWVEKKMLLPVATSFPSLARCEVTTVLPGDTVLALIAVGILDSTTTVGPELVVVSSAGSSRAGGDGLALVVSLVVFTRHSHRTHHGRGRHKEHSNGLHCEGW